MKAKSSHPVTPAPLSAAPEISGPASRRPVVVAANTAWNLAHFRGAVIKRLITEGYKVIAAAAPDGNEGWLRSIGADFRPLPIDPAGRSPLSDLRLLANLLRLIRAVRPSVLLTFTVKPNIYGGLAARITGTPLVATVTGLGSAFLARGALEWLVASLYQVAFARARAVLFQNPADRDLFIRRGLVAEGRTRLVAGSGIDLDYFQPMPSPSNGRFTFLLVGRLLRDKGIVEFAEAAQILRDEGYDAVFRIVGERRPDNPSAVPERQLERWVGHGLIEHGPPVDDIRLEIAGADCLVLPSYREGLPRSLVEGMAMARPLIASDVPGCRDVVENEVNGLLCAPRSAADLARALRAMLTLPPSVRSAMGGRGRSIAEARFGEDGVTAVYLAETIR